MHSVFSCVYGLLLQPDNTDPLDSTLALQAYDAEDGGIGAIMKHVKDHAAQKSRAAWVAELSGENMEDD